jgi:hypothetical protein
MSAAPLLERLPETVEEPMRTNAAFGFVDITESTFGKKVIGSMDTMIPNDRIKIQMGIRFPEFQEIIPSIHTPDEIDVDEKYILLKSDDGKNVYAGPVRKIIKRTSKVAAGAAGAAGGAGGGGSNYRKSRRRASRRRARRRASRHRTRRTSNRR